ncbi:beta-1,4 N-acetylgalactosaminyltransferase 2-like [Halichoeres trimaculatus]|uniref:beta-1,4 N-acetylgalactosaminyltransferase 2-like n=1 Tax=Halichoeres trimaculatus TaxID=147232 RepID=UPI003D9ECFD6
MSSTCQAAVFSLNLCFKQYTSVSLLYQFSEANSMGCMFSTMGEFSSSPTETFMALLNRHLLQLMAAVSVIALLAFYVHVFQTCSENQTTEHTRKQKLGVIPSVSPPPPPGPCTCPAGSMLLKGKLPQDKFEEIAKRRVKEMQQHKARTTSVLSSLLIAPPNSPLQYPIQGVHVQPLTPTPVPGLGLQAETKGNYKVSLSVSKGVFTANNTPEGVGVKGNGEKTLTIESASLESLNNVLAQISYTSTVYHIHTGDLASFQFEDQEAIFPITIRQLHVPVLYDMGTEISSHVTVATKTFLRYDQLRVLLNSIHRFYGNMKVVIADDSFEPKKVTGENILQYIMPPAQGWFAGRNLAVSQVTTKYFLWVDDDFLFTENTKIEKLVEIMEAVPELDVLGGAVTGNQFYFTLHYEEGDEMEGGCLSRKSKGRFHQLPGYPQCIMANGVVNFFLARTAAVQKVGFDPKLQRVAHSEFFMDGLGSLMVASCNHVSIGHQPRASNTSATYKKFRHPPTSDTAFKLQLHFFKNHLKCVHYG